MLRQTTIKILPAMMTLLLSGCNFLNFLPPREAFIRTFSITHPNNPHALFMEGKSYLSQGEPGKAASRFKAALRIQPRFEEARMGLAHAYREEKSYRAARQCYREILSKSRDNLQAIQGLAICEWRLEDTTAAKTLLLQALDLNATQEAQHPTAAGHQIGVALRNSMAEILYGDHHYGEALRYWEESLRLDPKQTQVLTLVEDLREYVKKYGSTPNFAAR